MPFKIVRNDITDMQVDAIVNTVDPQPVIGAGTDAMIHEKAGPGLLAARRKLGPMQTGQAAITPAYDLLARYVIFTVGPVWEGGSNREEALLRDCYDHSLGLALEHGCQSIAFPLICTGDHGFPKDKALQIAISAFSAFLREHELQICLVVFDRGSFRLSEKLFQSVTSYIDEHYVETFTYRAPERKRRPWLGRREVLESSAVMEDRCPCAPLARAAAPSLEDMLKQEDAGFSETLLKLIDKAGKKDPEVYKKALLTKQHFSKIRNDPHYRPTKATALSLALALELDLEATRDLIGRAGYALTNSSKFDLIIRWFIEQGNYNVVEINCVLFDHDQSLLGS